MLDSTDSVLQENAGVFNNDMGMVNALEGFTELRNEIEVEMRIQGGATIGRAGEKRAARRELINQMLITAGALQTYAEKTEDAVLLEMGNITRTKLGRFKTITLITRAQLMEEALADLILDEVGYTQTERDELNSAIGTFVRVMNGPREGIVAKSTATQQLAQLLRKATRLLNRRMNPLMVKYEASNPRFFLAYKNARKIVDSGVSLKKVAEPSSA